MIAGEGPDRERLERLATGLNGQVTFVGRVDEERLADLYARCLAVYYAPVDEDFGMVPYEAFLSAKPVVTAVDAGGPLEVVHDRRTGAVVEPDAAAVARGLRLSRRARRRGEGLGPRRPRARRARHLGRLRRRPPLVKVAYYSPLPPSRSGIADYSTLLLPALRERVEIVVAEQGKRAPSADVALYHVGNDPDAHGWIVDALCKRPGVVVLHEYVLHHLVAGITIGRRDGRGYLDAMERELGVAGRLLGLGVLDNLLPLLWETQPERFPLAGTILEHAQALIVHSSFVGGKARAAGYRGRIWRIPHPAWPLEHVDAGGRHRGRPADRLLRLPEHEQADPGAARGVRRLPARPARCAAAARRRGGRALRRAAPARAARPDRRRRRGWTTCPRKGCGR